MKTHLVIGRGEVGRALAVLLDCDDRDVQDEAELEAHYDYLHICFPFQIENFEQVVKDYAKQYSAERVIVHSTVKVGTCDKHNWTHSPVRGKHPNLLDGLKTFVKHYGGVHAEEVAEELKPFFPSYIAHEEAAITEAGKLWELVSYGMQIVNQRYVHEYCRRMNLPFSEVYWDHSESYNQGWKDLGHTEFIKPILDDQGGPIGGHCVVAGAELLNSNYRNLLAEVIIAVQKELTEGWAGKTYTAGDGAEGVL